jgi:D-alanyl-D-alanine carboxypeptidase/D-alanyl-D-alanine-endopeptidase (penicillin-binding protein 4)
VPLSGSRGRDTVYLTGSIGVGLPPDTVTLAVTDPPAYAARAFASALRRSGIPVARVRVARDTGEAASASAASRRIATRRSPPLAEIVAAILKPSQNWIAEQLLLTLGATRGEAGSWREGIAVERRYLLDFIGIDSAAFSMRDASGLSAQNLLTPGAIVQLLDHAQRAPWGEMYRLALAQPGVAGTTLSSRLPELEGRVFAKTGTIANVNSLSGYVTTDGGRRLIFSIMSNGSGLPSATVRRAIDALIMAIAREGGSQ